MRRLSSLLIFGFLLLLVHISPAHAATHPVSSTSVDWQRYDTAVFVVSTMNLLHTRGSHTTVFLMEHRLRVTRITVWADRKVAGLYFIQLERNNGSVVGRLAYQMGWVVPRGLSPLMRKLGAVPSPAQIALAFKLDPKYLEGSFVPTSSPV